MITCQCPAAAALETIPNVKCKQGFGQIQKVAFQRLTKDDGTRNAFTAAAAITALASWTPKLTAADSTKIVVSPYVENPTNEAGDALTFGGGNETIDGIESVIGANPSTFSAVLRNMPQSVIKVMKTLQCEAEAGNLGVFLFDGNGRIEAIKGTTEGEYYPIPVRSLFVGDKAHGGFDAPDSNAIQWSFLPNYSDNLEIVVPEFNPLTDLVVTE